jgi:hypothetical protein
MGMIVSRPFRRSWCRPMALALAVLVPAGCSTWEPQRLGKTVYVDSQPQGAAIYRTDEYGEHQVGASPAVDIVATDGEIYRRSGWCWALPGILGMAALGATISYTDGTPDPSTGEKTRMTSDLVGGAICAAVSLAGSIYCLLRPADGATRQLSALGSKSLAYRAVADGYQSDMQREPLTAGDAHLLFKLRPLDGSHPSSGSLSNLQPGRPFGTRPRNSIVGGAGSGVQNPRHLAVLEFQGKGLDDDILMTLSDTARGGALGGIEGRGIAVMTRENMLVLLRDMGKKECGEGDCEVETARNLGADFVVSGRVVRMERLYVVTLKLHETKGGTLLGTTTAEGASQVDVLRLLRERGRRLVSEGLRLQDGQ